MSRVLMLCTEPELQWQAQPKKHQDLACAVEVGKETLAFRADLVQQKVSEVNDYKRTGVGP